MIPLLSFSVILVVITMPGPIFFTQKRIGKNGTPFVIYKIRTMKLHKSISSIAANSDSFITPVGQFLRKTKLDELPQLINILTGKMSIVGPRPDLPGRYDKLIGEDKIILKFRPGLTGLDSMVYPFEELILAKQENPSEYYNKVIWPHKVRLNKWYVENWSFLLDLKIVINTITQLIIGKQFVIIKTNIINPIL